MIKVDVNWKAFLISELFDVNIRGRRLTLTEREDGDYPFVTAGENNNGISSFINNHNQAEHNNSITLDMFGNSFYQDWKFKCDDNITILKNNLTNKYSSIFIAALLNRLRVKYSYGNQVRPNRLKNDRVMLPVDSKGNPDYKLMEEYILKIEKKKTTEYINFITSRTSELLKTNQPESLQLKEWKEFSLIKIFNEIQRGKRLKKDDHIEGEIPYASSTALNNGIDAYIGNAEKVRVFENCLTLANSGSVGATFFHPYKVIASDHVTKLENKDFNKYVYLFLSTMVSRLNEKYSFNREINDLRIKKEKVLLPINEKGNPDYQYMEDYMKYLEYQKLKEYLEFKK